VRALIQRVTAASVSVEGQQIGQCGAGLLILVCAMQDDTEARAAHLAAKIAKLRIFKDAEGRMNRSILDIRVRPSSSASSRWPPTPHAATAPASPPPPHPSLAATSTTISPQR